MKTEFPSIADLIGQTPVVALQRLVPMSAGQVLLKLEGNNPAGSVKDRPAFNMIIAAQERGEIQVGDTIIEPTSGNTGIGLAMAAAVLGYKMVLVMPENSSIERVHAMQAYGAKVVLTAKALSMPGAIDEAKRMVAAGQGVILNQFGNPDNPDAHFKSTGPEIWQQTHGKITHFVSSMGTTGTIMGVSRYLKSQNPAIQIVGVQPEEGSQIPGIRKWEAEYLPSICDYSRIDELRLVSQQRAEDVTRKLAKEEGVLAGISSGGALAVALDIANENSDALVVSIVCDRGDRYLSTGIFAD